MKSPELAAVTEDKTAIAAGRTALVPTVAAVAVQAGVVIDAGGPDDAVERAFASAVRDQARLGELLDVLAAGRLWLPLPDDGRPVTDGSAVHLPTVRYLGELFVPAYTSAARLLRAAGELAPGQRATVLPHAVVAAADLARRLPPRLGIALNPQSPESVPVYPAGVAHLAAEHGAAAGGARVSVGPLPCTPADLLVRIREGLTGVRQAREAAAAWLAVATGARRGEGLVVAVTLDDPADAAARDAVVAAVQRAADAARDGAGSLDVTFPGEGEPDVIDRWLTSFATPFYRRPIGLPAPRPASA
jgi:hypothetical protein